MIGKLILFILSLALSCASFIAFVISYSERNVIFVFYFFAFFISVLVALKLLFEIRYLKGNLNEKEFFRSDKSNFYIYKYGRNNAYRKYRLQYGFSEKYSRNRIKKKNCKTNCKD